MTLSAVILLVVTSVAVLGLLALKTERRGSYLLPLVALVPIVLQYVGLGARARQASYVLLVLFLALEVLRLVRPATTRWLAMRFPSLLPATERVRPLSAGSAVTAAALLVHLLAPQQAVVAATLGIVGVACGTALQARWPTMPRKLVRGTTRGLAAYLALVLLVLTPAALVLGHFSVATTLLAAGATFVAALLPLQTDRFLLSPLAAGLALLLLTR